MPTNSLPHSLLFRNALLITQDASRRVFRGDLRIENGEITHVGEAASTLPAEETVEASEFAIVPGFINAHAHVAMTLLRGYADDRDLTAFLNRLFALDARRTEADMEAGAVLGVAEMLLSGTTSFLDLYYGEDAVARAVERLGIHGFLGWAVLDEDKTTQKGSPLHNARAFIDRWKHHSLVTPLVAPQGVYVCNAETWRGAAELARSAGTLLHFHLSETRGEVHAHERQTGKRPPVWLDEQGALGPNAVAAHGVWLTPTEIALLARRGVAVAHCPSSNLKLATGGVCPVLALQAAGSPVGLGTDSAASNNSLSLLREMHLAGLLQKHHRWDAGVLPAQTLLDMVTRDGARLLGRSTQLGSLEPGKRADFFLLRLDHPTVMPARADTIVSHLAYAASEEAIDSVYVEGRQVIRHRSLVSESWPSIRKEAEQAAGRLWATPAL